jgi:hypothetical protein
MSLDNRRTGDKPSCCVTGEGRREETGQQSAFPQRSGGVGVDSTSVSSTKISWEISGGGCKTRPNAQAGRASEAGGAAGEVGIPCSSDEAPVTGMEQRGDTCSEVRSDRWPKAPQGDTPPRCQSSSTLTEGSSGNARTRPDSESRIRENRPFGSMRGGRESVIGLVPLNPTSPPTLPCNRTATWLCRQAGPQADIPSSPTPQAAPTASPSRRRWGIYSSAWPIPETPVTGITRTVSIAIWFKNAPNMDFMNITCRPLQEAVVYNGFLSPRVERGRISSAAPVHFRGWR